MWNWVSFCMKFARLCYSLLPSQHQWWMRMPLLSWNTWLFPWPASPSVPACGSAGSHVTCHWGCSTARHVLKHHSHCTISRLKRLCMLELVLVGCFIIIALAQAVSQHADMSKNTKAAFKCCYMHCTLYLYPVPVLVHKFTILPFCPTLPLSSSS